MTLKGVGWSWKETLRSACPCDSGEQGIESQTHLDVSLVAGEEAGEERREVLHVLVSAQMLVAARGQHQRSSAGQYKVRSIDSRYKTGTSLQCDRDHGDTAGIIVQC